MMDGYGQLQARLISFTRHKGFLNSILLNFEYIDV
jgi:hypothetical protein